MSSVCIRRISMILASLVVLTTTNSLAMAQKRSSKAERAIAENKELDRQFADAFNKKDLDQLMGLYWQSPDLVLISPDGTITKGWEAVRKDFQDFFASVDSVEIEFTEANYIPAGDGVIGFGTATMHMQSKNRPHEVGTIRYTDYAEKKGGKWVLVHDHAHMVLPPTGPQPTDSLYKRLGGYDAIAAVTDDFILKLATHPQLQKFFGGVSGDSQKRIRQLVLDQLCAATGGPCVYIGRTMKTSHVGLGISGRDWDIAVGLLVQSLTKFNVPAKEQNDLATALASLRADIVEK